MSIQQLTFGSKVTFNEFLEIKSEKIFKFILVENKFLDPFLKEYSKVFGFNQSIYSPDLGYWFRLGYHPLDGCGYLDTSALEDITEYGWYYWYSPVNQYLEAMEKFQ